MIEVIVRYMLMIICRNVVVYIVRVGCILFVLLFSCVCSVKRLVVITNRELNEV